MIAYNKFAGDLDRVGGRLETFAHLDLLARQLDEGGRDGHVRQQTAQRPASPADGRNRGRPSSMLCRSC